MGIEIYQGKFKLPPPRFRKKFEIESSASTSLGKRGKISKVVVFDLDETLGSFSDLFLLWTGMKHFYPDFQDLPALIHIYPEFLRNGIISILQFLSNKKRSRECEKVFIYTNNQCPPAWVTYIIQYFESKLQEYHHDIEIKPLFDKIIGAFIPLDSSNRLQVKYKMESGRTTHQKTYSDLIQCTMLPKNTEYCFVDDTEYVKMKHDKIYYIRPKAYIHSLSVQEIIDRWYQHFATEHPLLISSYWYSWFSLHNRSGFLPGGQEIDLHRTVSRKLMFHIREFFLLTTYHPFWTSKKTKKKREELATIFGDRSRMHHKTYKKTNAYFS